MELISHSLTPVVILVGIRSLVGVGSLVRPLAHPALYLRQQSTRLYLNIFQGEPAISELD